MLLPDAMLQPQACDFRCVRAQYVIAIFHARNDRRKKAPVPTIFLRWIARRSAMARAHTGEA
jgi:hypothetical protein